ncbi:DEAD/DEAH box helicase [Salinispira pacifica]|uniref:Cold-shock DEAD-box protein A n=1 Tax=Salinispira pacifica TaxID=1307761 RepID=V5WDR9_9SPIO|nr:DEAD/DEAH box helicase [Salinispira pacifica]AHC13953.1 Cold-shock DEAD-box protein A [Salinispira pacifica]
MTFSDFQLDERILSALTDMGFTEPTEIQQQALPLLMEHPARDFIGLAQTGTGKTAAFGLPLLEVARAEETTPQALILSPTRELALQISDEMNKFSRNLTGIRITTVYGGASISDQIRELRRGSQIVVATPGRLADLIRRKKIDIGNITNLVLDEADIMLNMGFKQELDEILEQTPSAKRVILLSATMPPEVARIAATYMENPSEVKVGTKNASADTISHNYCMVHSKDKYHALKRLLDSHPEIYGIVFCRTKASTQHIAEHLIRDGYNSAPLHGDLSQAQRDQVMKNFRNGGTQILVATDVAARGLDVDHLSHVIHYDLPDEPENYVHRSGRTGRAGRTGHSVAIINMKEKGKIRRIERSMNGTIARMRVPDGQEICEHQLMHLVDRVHNVQVDESRIAKYMPIIEEKLAALDREELLKHFVSLEFNRFLDYYKDAGDLNPSEHARESGRYDDRDGRRGRGRRDNADRGGRDRRDGRSDDRRDGRRGSKEKPFSKDGPRAESFDIISVNVGRNDKVLPPQIIGMVNEATKLRHIEIGRIDIDSASSNMMVDSRYSSMVAGALDNYQYRGKTISAKIVSSGSGRKSGSGSAPSGGRSGRKGGKRGGKRSEARKKSGRN